MSMIELSSPHKNMDIMQPEGVKGVIQEDSSDVYAAVHNWWIEASQLKKN